MNCHITYTSLVCSVSLCLASFLDLAAVWVSFVLADLQMLTFRFIIRAVVPVVLLRPGPGRPGTLVQIDGHPPRPGWPVGETVDVTGRPGTRGGLETLANPTPLQ